MIAIALLPRGVLSRYEGYLLQVRSDLESSKHKDLLDRAALGQPNRTDATPKHTQQTTQHAARKQAIAHFLC